MTKPRPKKQTPASPQNMGRFRIVATFLFFCIVSLAYFISQPAEASVPSKLAGVLVATVVVLLTFIPILPQVNAWINNFLNPAIRGGIVAVEIVVVTGLLIVALLPILSPTPHAKVALMFLADTSGAMTENVANTNTTRFDVALEAISEISRRPVINQPENWRGLRISKGGSCRDDNTELKEHGIGLSDNTLEDSFAKLRTDLYGFTSFRPGLTKAINELVNDPDAKDAPVKMLVLLLGDLDQGECGSLADLTDQLKEINSVYGVQSLVCLYTIDAPDDKFVTLEESLRGIQNACYQNVKDAPTLVQNAETHLAEYYQNTTGQSFNRQNAPLASQSTLDEPTSTQNTFIASQSPTPSQLTSGIVWSDDSDVSAPSVTVYFNSPMPGGGISICLYVNGGLNSCATALASPSDTKIALMGGWNGFFSGADDGTTFRVDPGGASCSIRIVSNGNGTHKYCGVFPDNDNDGIPNSLDSCPSEGDLGYGLQADGCPGQQLELYIDKDTLTLYIPQKTSLSGLQFVVVNSGGQELHPISDFFSVLQLTQDVVEADSCYVIRLSGSDSPLPSKCQTDRVFRVEVAPSDIFWYDNVASRQRDVAIYKDDTQIAICSSAEFSCVIPWSGQ